MQHKLSELEMILTEKHNRHTPALRVYRDMRWDRRRSLFSKILSFLNPISLLQDLAAELRNRKPAPRLSIHTTRIEG